MAQDINKSRLSLAREGETLAASYLEQAGYEIVTRNSRTRWGEIDLVARDRGTWVFVEVKTRRSERYGYGAEAVTYHKQQKIIRMAQIILSRLNQTEVPVRFDVIEVTLRPQQETRLRHLINAFEA